MRVELNHGRKQDALSVIERVLDSAPEGRITFQKSDDLFSVFATSEVEPTSPS
jgi:hypothetical protein